MSRAFLQVHDVVCSYGVVPVLDGVSLVVRKGDFVAVVGPNGSGKSTLLRSISRALPPLMGKVLLEGRDIYGLPARELARRLATVGQEERVDFPFTVEEVVLMGRHPHVRPLRGETARDLAVTREAMDLTGVSHLAERPFQSLSGGEKQRAVIARALAQEPQVLLLDEPTSHLDINHQMEVMELLLHLNRVRDITVLAVLHDLNLAAQYADHVVLVKDGQIYRLGSPDRVITAENLQAVYGTEVLVIRHPLRSCPYVVLKPKAVSGAADSGRRTRVHVVGGGGMAGELLRSLVRRGYRVTAGVINVGDNDWAECRHLGIRVVEAPPFCPIGDGEHRENISLMQRSRAVLVADIPFGHGNLRNLEAIETVMDCRGGPARYLILGRQNLDKRDFTGGQARVILERLTRKGLVWIPGEQEALDALEREGRDGSQEPSLRLGAATDGPRGEVKA